ncbi:SGNH/GDSL hydrolase family protein [bacterium]
MKLKFVLIVCLLFMTQLVASEPILSNHPNIQYTGRIDFSNSLAPVIFWPGTYIKANFEGTSLQVILDDSTGTNFYNVIIDNNVDDFLILYCRKGTHSYPVAVGLKDTIHHVMIFRRTEGFSGQTRFKGFILDTGKSLADAPERPARKIEFYGNSITCGMGNEVPDHDEDENNAKRNNYLAYGAITARNLNADYTCIAKSGIGVLISWFDIIMPEYYDRLNPWKSDSKWDFTQWTPDVVVINLFQNDSWLIKKLDPVPDEEQIIQAYLDFVALIRNTYQDANIICTLGSMDAVADSSAWPGYVQKAVDRFKDEQDDQKIDALFFAFDGTYKHPRVRHHEAMADKLTAFIKDKLNW